MKASEAHLVKFLQKNAQFVIPIYQRTYSWTQKQCEQLWLDIVRAAGNEHAPAHFVGSIVYIERGLYHHSLVPQLLVIDGQQRLTTITLLLAALRSAIVASGDESEIRASQIENYALFNRDEMGELRYKLLLTQNDRETLKRILDNTPQLDQASRRVIGNHQFFVQRIAATDLSPAQIFRGVQKLLVVDISLDRQHDNPQLIFESLNSTGLQLSQADLIRNYVLMDLEPKEQESIYESYWLPIEQSFGESQLSSHFDRFMRDFLTIKTGQIPNEAAVYEAFKGYDRSYSGSIQSLVVEIHRYAGYFANLALEHETDGAIREAIRDVNALKVNVAYPFLLAVYHDYATGVLPKQDLVGILRLVESYILRRGVCAIPTNSLNKTFQNLHTQVVPDRYLESVRAALLLLDSYRRFPNDEEFKQEFIARDTYNTGRRNYVLRKLETHGQNEIVNVEAFIIEHIMPQNPNLSPAWQQMLGPDWRGVQERYLHTIGNLTLTGYNPEMSDHAFLEKRDMPHGFGSSPLRLNQDLRTLEEWNEEQIKTRAARLADRAITIWPSPQLPESVFASYRGGKKTAPTQYTLADHPNVQGALLEVYEKLRRQILNLDPAVYEDIRKLYIAFKAETNFVDIETQKNTLSLTLNLEFQEIDDPRGWCRDVTGIGTWGNGDVQVKVSSLEQIDYAMDLIRQSFQKQMVPSVA